MRLNELWLHNIQVREATQRIDEDIYCVSQSMAATAAWKRRKPQPKVGCMWQEINLCSLYALISAQTTCSLTFRANAKTIAADGVMELNDRSRQVSASFSKRLVASIYEREGGREGGRGIIGANAGRGFSPTKQTVAIGMHHAQNNLRPCRRRNAVYLRSIDCVM